MKRFSVSCIGTYETCGYKCLRQYNKIGEEKIEDDKNFYGEFGALLHDLFDKHYKENLTQEQFAMKLNVSRQAVSNWENNKNLPDIGMSILMSNVFQISGSIN